MGSPADGGEETGITRRILATLVLLIACMPAIAQAPTPVIPVLRGTAATADGPVPVELKIDRRQHAKLNILRPDGTIRRSVPLATPHDVLALLIDRRLAFLWPALTEWAGPDLTRLRDRVLAESDAAFARGKIAGEPSFSDRVAGSKAGVLLNRVRMLTSGGRYAEALMLLNDAAANWSPGKPWDRASHGQVLVALARYLLVDGDEERADALLRDFEQSAETRGEKLNVLVNRASLLAEAGRYAEALAAVDKARAAYASYQDTIGGMVATVPGSERHFASIRACALAGLGRREEARLALAPLMTPDAPRSLLFPVDPAVVIRRGAYLCMRDPTALAEAVTASLTAFPLTSDLLPFLSPDIEMLPREARILTAARTDPRYLATAREIVRPLPRELHPAANGWIERADRRKP